MPSIVKFTESESTLVDTRSWWGQGGVGGGEGRGVGDGELVFNGDSFSWGR